MAGLQVVINIFSGCLPNTMYLLFVKWVVLSWCMGLTVE
jgi:hypothetical protein